MSGCNLVAPPQKSCAADLQVMKLTSHKINPGASSASDSRTKRSLDEGSEPVAKKVTPPAGHPRQSNRTMVPGSFGGVYTEDIKVPDKMVRLIIGRGGEQITRLQSESGCKIQMAPDSGGTPDRICTLTGNPQAISRAKELVNAVTHPSCKTEGHGSFGPLHKEIMSGLPQSQTLHNPSFLMVEIMLPGPMVGLVIGKGGENIKQLQEKSKTTMFVVQEGPNQEAEKPLRITGRPKKVKHAVALVFEILTKNENQFQARGRGGFRGRRGSFFQQRGEEEAQYFVPSNKCGVIIGRGGETIRQINKVTGAHCELDRRSDCNPNEKIFSIRGAPEQIKAAKKMIAKKLIGPVSSRPQQQWAPSYHQPVVPNVTADAVPNMAQADYSQQWIEYYRRLGMHSEADGIEQQTKAKAQPQQNIASADYSAQWVQYYRNLGDFKQAEVIEQQMKARQQQSQHPGMTPGTPQSSPQLAAPAHSQTPQFLNYYPGGGFCLGYQVPVGTIGEQQAVAKIQQ